jgi:hypothetical protein
MYKYDKENKENAVGLKHSCLGQSRIEKTLLEEFRDYYNKKSASIIKEKPYFPPIKDEEEFTSFFVKNMVQAFDEVNRPYNMRCGYGRGGRVKLGLWYATEYPEASYVLMFTPSLVANEKFWRVTEGYNGGRRFQMIKKCLPSDALHAWFEGPTFCDCGSTLQACLWMVLCKIVGTKNFDQFFSKEVPTFAITQSFEGACEYHPLLLKGKCEEKYLEYKNSLDCVFDDIEPSISIESKNSENGIVKTIEEKNIMPLDFVYLKGVDGYSEKHPRGAHAGEYLICVGKNGEGKNLYLGFNPQYFQTPKTYEEIKNMLIEEYNKANDVWGGSGTDLVESPYMGHVKYSKEKTWENASSIVGFVGCKRLNWSKLKILIERINGWSMREIWWRDPMPKVSITSECIPHTTKNFFNENNPNKKININVNLPLQITKKNNKKYVPHKKADKEMLKIAQKFAVTLINKHNKNDNSIPVVLVVSEDSAIMRETNFSYDLTMYLKQFELKVINNADNMEKLNDKLWCILNDKINLPKNEAKKVKLEKIDQAVKNYVDGYDLIIFNNANEINVDELGKKLRATFNNKSLSEEEKNRELTEKLNKELRSIASDKNLSQEKKDKELNARINEYARKEKEKHSALAYVFLRCALKYVIDTKKSMLITADDNFNFAYYIPEYMGYEHDLDGFCVMLNNSNANIEKKNVNKENVDKKNVNKNKNNDVTVIKNY